MKETRSSGYELFPPDGFAFLQGLHGGSPFTDFALMGAFIVVVIDPCVEILWLLDGLVDLLWMTWPLPWCLPPVYSCGPGPSLSAAALTWERHDMGRRIPHPALVNPHRWGVVRRFILKRDGYRCRACGKAGRLEV